MKSMGVPAKVIQDFQPFLSNMLGIIRGNVYYNLVNWYRLLTCMPVGDTSQFMETMMGVKQVRIMVSPWQQSLLSALQTLHSDIEAQLGVIKSTAPRYSIWTRLSVILSILQRSMCLIVGTLSSFFM